MKRPIEVPLEIYEAMRATRRAMAEHGQRSPEAKTEADIALKAYGRWQFQLAADGKVVLQ
jgi:hypothetical protein